MLKKTEPLGLSCFNLSFLVTVDLDYGLAFVTLRGEGNWTQRERQKLFLGA